MPRISRAEIGSSPRVGSSRNSTGGWCSRAAGDHQTLLHTGRESPHRALGSLSLSDPAEHLIDVALGHVVEPAISTQISPCGKPLIQVLVFEHDPNECFQLRLVFHKIAAGHAGAAPPRFDLAGEHPDGSCLARAIRAQQGKYLSSLHRETGADDSLNLFECAAKIISFYHWVFHIRCCLFSRTLFSLATGVPAPMGNGLTTRLWPGGPSIFALWADSVGLARPCHSGHPDSWCRWRCWGR